MISLLTRRVTREWAICNQGQHVSLGCRPGALSGAFEGGRKAEGPLAPLGVKGPPQKKTAPADACPIQFGWEKPSVP